MYEEENQPDPDYLYDCMRDEFLLIQSKEDAINCIKIYGYSLSNKYLPKHYKYLLKENNELIKKDT
jgi:hypothetical protein